MKHLLFSYKEIQQITLLTADKPIRQSSELFQLLLIVEGKGELSIDDEKLVLEAGSLYFINRHRFIEIHSLTNSDLYFYQLSFDIIEHKQENPYQLEAPQLKDAMLYCPYDQPWLEDGELYGASFLPIRNMMQQLYALQENNEHWHSLEQQRTLYELLSLVVQHSGVPKTEKLSSTAEHRQHIQHVIRFMQQHYAEDISRNEMAQLAGFHPRSFTKIFKEETGVNFIDYLTQIRIKKAMELILLSKLTLDVVAQRVGYSNGLYLSRKFKQSTGFSPKQYVKSLNRIVVYDWVGNVLALNIKPVGASYFYSLSNLQLLKDELTEVTDVGRQSIDKVVELEPQLIIVPKWLEAKTIHELQQIAPTLIVPYGNPFERFKQLAELLDRQQEADAFISMYKTRATAIKQELATVIGEHETVGLYELSDAHIWVLNEFHGRGGYNLFEGLKLKPPINVQKRVIGKGQVIRLNMEQIPEYAADHMIISYNFTEEGHAHAAKMLAHPIWRQIEAFHNKRIYTIDRGLFHPNDVYSLYKQLELQRKLLLNTT